MIVPEEVEILLVEDNPTDAELALRALRKNKIANHTAWVKDGAEALEFLFCEGKYEGRGCESQPRLILLDLKLPKVNGLQVLERIKADDRTREIPVVMMTSSAEERDLHESYSHGVNSYIVKPLDFSEFSKVVGDAGFYWMLVNKLPQH